jgi:predicted outer membrane repeat protein
MNPRVKIALLCGLGWLLLSGSVDARTWRVPAEAPTIQAGIDSAAVADTVLVAPGTYFEHDLAMKGGVILLGDEAAPETVIVDPGQRGRGLDCFQLAEPAVVAGLTFTGGRVVDGWMEALGAGVRCRESELTLQHCRFIGNTARIGAGLGFRDAHVTVTDCTFFQNEATHPEWAAGGGIWVRDSSGAIRNSLFTGNTAFSTNLPGDGGGVFVNNGDLEVSDCVFQKNATGGGAGAFYTLNFDSSLVANCQFEENSGAWGGAFYFEESFAHLNGCSFRANRALHGGALLIGRNSAPELDDCLFTGNQATTGNGGAIDCWQSAPVILRARFLTNSAQIDGGAMNFSDSRPELLDCIMLGNTAGCRGGALRGHYSVLQVAGGTLAANGAPAGGGMSCGTATSAAVEHTIIAFSSEGASISALDTFAARVQCSDFFGNAGGDWGGGLAAQLGQYGNIAADPLFCDMAGGDVRLHAGSPCAAGNSPCGLMGALAALCGLSDAPTAVPAALRINPAFPNPFNPRTTLRLDLPAAAPTRVAVYDPAGRLVRVLLDEPLARGPHAVTWDGRDAGDRPLPAGLYFFVVTSGRQRGVGRAMLIK